MLLVALNLMCGSVEIPAGEVFNILTGSEVEKASWRYIVLESRLPQTITAMLCGATLSTSGLLLQTAFRNPLAGPSILGITSGASLGVALVILFFGGILGISLTPSDTVQFTGYLAVVSGAMAGAMAVIALLLMLSTFIRSNTMLLITGIMISYLTTSVVSLLNYFAAADNIQSFTMWGMGSFSDVTLSQLPFYSVVSVSGLFLSCLLIKPLDALLLGDNYATNLGVNISFVRRLLLFTTGMLTAVTTAFCGPVSFIGLAVPHIARLLTRTSSHTTLLPVTILSGASIALLCNLICVLPANLVLPLNAVTPLFGAPVILYIIIKGNTRNS